MHFDFFNRPFELENITNLDQVDIINLTEFSALDERDKKQVVLITGKDDKQRLYLLSDLCALLKANDYSRLEDPLTRENILEQIPPLKNAALLLLKQAGNYNAYVLNNNPEFIEILTEYAKIMLGEENANAFSHTKLADVPANQNDQLDRLYTKIISMDENKQELLKSLFITNRRSFHCNIDPHDPWDLFPAKWIPADALEQKQYTRFSNQYRDFPHQNVLVGDLITDPATACIHSWGMDITYLLLEYHLGVGKSLELFKDHSIPAIRELEKELKQRLANNPMLQPEQGNKALEAIKEITNNLLNSLIQDESFQEPLNEPSSNDPSVLEESEDSLPPIAPPPIKPSIGKEEIEREIQRLKTNATDFFSIGNRSKAKCIKEALDIALSKNIEDVRKDGAVQKALAKHRIFGFFGLLKTQATHNIEKSFSNNR